MQAAEWARDITDTLRGEDEQGALERLARLQPFDRAEVLAHLEPADRLRLVRAMPTSLAAETLEYLEPETQYRILDHLDEPLAAALLQAMSSDTVVDLLLALHPLQAAKLKAWLPSAYRERIDTLMTFPENTAGSLATIEYIAAREGWTVQQALDHVRKVGHDAEVVSYVYVVDARGRLVRVASLRELILADPRAPLTAVGRPDVIAVRATADREEAARLLTRYDFVALPVVDDQNRLLGIITIDDIVDVIHREATEDIQRLGGSVPLAESYFKTPVPVLFRKRVGWLLTLFVAEAYTGTVLRHFEDILSRVVGLAFFIPLLIGTGGNTGSQTVSTLVRALAVGEVTFRDWLRVLARELATGTLLGTVMAAAALVRAYTLGVGPQLGPVVAVTALFIVLWASMVSAVLPLLLHRLRVDPAVVSGPFISTLVDGTGLFLYFTVAQVMLRLT
ncbi:magnesium transporter [Thermaerobacter marianensis DSM 12885]|uniref:Magnesium transporter MgtE n=1 Tax=Thermaerobacter marianensis (strain ATCC 700841 / DSM 12885 / JCM 10246 / 7p75a) TaxID=644966 RepID=E6SM20_THEM7|nr:magnesium transporter [Thermaerobacter marianensis]ADU50350.1 magnesium transporter [Thermaerobacter marianensis DSM 12885]